MPNGGDADRNKQRQGGTQKLLLTSLAGQGRLPHNAHAGAARLTDNLTVFMRVITHLCAGWH
jgi:hypothetical protein